MRLYVVWAAALAVLVGGIGSAQGEVAIQQDEYDATEIEGMVQAAVEDAVLRYESDGKKAFEEITGLVPSKVDYPTFILNSTTSEIEAYAAQPHMVGRTLSGVFAADRPYDEIVEELRSGEGIWVTSLLTNQDTLSKQTARVWLTLNDGYVFGAGYYLRDFKLQSLVEQIVSVFDHDRDEAFAMINSLTDEDETYIIAVDPIFQTILADNQDPERIGHPWSDYYKTYQSPTQIFELLIHGGVWVNNLEVNPATGADQLRRSWVHQHGGVIFVPAYFITDSEARSVVDLARLIYQDNPQTAFDRLTLAGGNGQDHMRMGDDAFTDVTHPFVINGTTHQIVAHGAIPEFVDECCSEARQETGDLTLDDIIEDIREGGAVWATYNVTNPDSGTVSEKRAWLSWHDGFVFGSGYGMHDSQVQSIAAHYAFAYEDSGDINQLGPVNPSSHLYLFVIDPETLEVVKHGGKPDLAADDSLSLTAADRTTAEILADLESSLGTWSEYTTVNPETGMQEHKRSWLIMYDGYVFGAGYYDSDLG